MRPAHPKSPLRLTGLALAVAAGFATPAIALDWQIRDVGVQLDTRLTESLVLRTESADPRLVGIANGGRAYSVNADDSTLATSKGSLVAATTRLTPALSLSWKNLTLFARANYSWDPRVDGRHLFDADDFGAGHQFDLAKRHDAERVMWDETANDFAMLDAYAYTEFKVFGHSLTIKAGQQSVSWGEAFLVRNGLNSIQAYNANKANTPALELDEITRPYPQVFASIDLWKGISVDGWYQVKWRRTIAPYAGTFFSTNDYIPENGIGGNIDFGRAGEYVEAGGACSDPNLFPPGFTFSCIPYGGSIPRAGDRGARDGGQFGVAVNGTLPILNSLVFTLNAAKFHSRLPMFSSISAASGNPDASTAQVIGEYPEDIRMYGFSFNVSGPMGVALQGEYSYKPNQPLEIDDVEQSLADLGAPSQISPIPGQTLGNQYIRGWRRHGVSVWDLSAVHLLGPNPTLGYDEFLTLFEFGFVRVHDLESKDVLRYEGPGTFLPGDAASAALLGVPQQHGGFATANSAGFNLLLRATWHNILQGVQFKPSLRWSMGVNGITPAPLLNFVEDTHVLNPQLQFVIGDSTTIDLGYSRFFGGGQSNTLIDRDFVSLDFKYSF